MQRERKSDKGKRKERKKYWKNIGIQASHGTDNNDIDLPQDEMERGRSTHRRRNAENGHKMVTGTAQDSRYHGYHEIWGRPWDMRNIRKISEWRLEAGNRREYVDNEYENEGNSGVINMSNVRRRAEEYTWEKRNGRH